MVAGMPLDSVSLGRRTDAFNDIDLVEIDPKKLGAKNFATYQLPQKSDAKMDPDWEDSPPTETPIYGWLKANKSSLSIWKKREKVMQATPEVTQIDQRQKYFVLMPPWSAREQAEASWTGKDKFAHRESFRPWHGLKLRENPFSGTFTIPSRIAPGMSCAPLLNKDGYLKGMGVEYKNDMADSTFASRATMLSNLFAYLHGKTQSDISAEWKSQNGLLYLQMGEQNAEIVPRKVAGSPLRFPSGNGVSTPPGNGVSTPPGNGVSTPPGQKKLTKVETCNPNELAGRNGWEKVGTPPAVLWNGKPVMGFSMKFEGYREPFFVAADRAGMKLRMKAEKFTAKVEDVPLGSPILQWLDRRFTQLNDNIPKTFTLYSESIDPEDQVSGIREGPSIDRYKDFVAITFYGPAPQHEKIEIVLNEKGALISPVENNPNEFLPMVEVPAPSGQVYLVDLSDLFQTSANEWGGASSPGDRELVERWWAGETGLKGDTLEQDAIDGVKEGLAAAAIPTISYRKKCASQQYDFQIASMKPLMVKHESNCERYIFDPLFIELETLPAILEKLKED